MVNIQHVNEVSTRWTDSAAVFMDRLCDFSLLHDTNVCHWHMLIQKVVQPTPTALRKSILNIPYFAIF